MQSFWVEASVLMLPILLSLILRTSFFSGKTVLIQYFFLNSGMSIASSIGKALAQSGAVDELINFQALMPSLVI